LNPEEFNQIYNDTFVKKYLTALIKKQWGQNLTKYKNIQLPGGISMNGEELLMQGTAEVAELESKMLTDYSLPPLDVVG
jgi:hypothetical protein